MEFRWPKATCRFGFALQIEAASGLRNLAAGIHVGGRQHDHDLLALSQSHTAELNILAQRQRGLVNCTGVRNRRNSFTARSARLQSSSSQYAQDQDFSGAHAPTR